MLQGYQRHLIELAFVDRILGELLARLRATDLYDRALVIIAADHGAAFWPEQSRRQLQRTEHPEEILRIPLLVKAPQQRAARIDPRAASVIDIVPTIAATLGIDLPWQLDGCALSESTCPGERELVAYGGKDGKRERLGYSLQILQRSVGLRRKLRLFGTGPGTGGLFEIGAYKTLVGRPVSDLEIAGDLRGPAGALRRVSRCLPAATGRIRADPYHRAPSFTREFRAGGPARRRPRRHRPFRGTGLRRGHRALQLFRHASSRRLRQRSRTPGDLRGPRPAGDPEDAASTLPLQRLRLPLSARARVANRWQAVNAVESAASAGHVRWAPTDRSRGEA